MTESDRDVTDVLDAKTSVDVHEEDVQIDNPTSAVKRLSEALKQTSLVLEELEVGTDAHDAAVEALQNLEVAQKLVDDDGGDA